MPPRIVTVSRVFTVEDARLQLEEMERGFAEESRIRQMEGRLALRRWQFMRRGHPMITAHARAVAVEAEATA